jgi:hypothetical protein
LWASDVSVLGKNIESRPYIALHQRAVKSRSVSAFAERIGESAPEHGVAWLHERLNHTSGGNERRIERIVGAVAALDAFKQACADAKFGKSPHPHRSERRSLTEIL